MRRKSSARVTPEYESKSGSASPVRCARQSTSVTSRVIQGSRSWNSGMCLMTGSVHCSRPSSTSMASAVALNALVIEAIGKTVSASTRAFPPSLRTP